jgi:hypothetical protein
MNDSSAAALPTHIDGIVSALDGIVERSIARGDRAGYFAALYNRVTRAVRTGIQQRAFDDNARMERLDVAFANRYLDAYQRYHRGEPTTASWDVAFSATRDSRLSVFRQLILGMNAHINLDLGIACAEIARGGNLEQLHADFNRINTVLGSLLPVVEAQLGEIAPRLGAAARVGHELDRLDERAGRFSMEKARDGAWRLAQRLSRLDSESSRHLAIAARDAATALLGTELRTHHAVGDIVSGPDGSGVANHIRILARL